MSKPQLQICNKLLPTRSSSATVTTSSSFELASLHARVASIKLAQRYGVSESVSYWQALPMIGLGSNNNFKHDKFKNQRQYHLVLDNGCRTNIFESIFNWVEVVHWHWLGNWSNFGQVPLVIKENCRQFSNSLNIISLHFANINTNTNPLKKVPLIVYWQRYIS